MSALLVASRPDTHAGPRGNRMRQSRPYRSLPLVLARAVALFVLVPALGLALAIEVSSGTVGGAGAATAGRTDGDGAGQMMAADPNGGYWTTTAGGAITPHDGAPALGS